MIDAYGLGRLAFRLPYIRSLIFTMKKVVRKISWILSYLTNFWNPISFDMIIRSERKESHFTISSPAHDQDQLFSLKRAKFKGLLGINVKEQIKKKKEKE